MKILFTGGGTGGHIFPIIAIIRELKAISQGSDLDLFFFGPKHEIYSSHLANEGVIVKNVLTGKIRRYFNVKSFFSNIIDVLFRVPVGIIQSFFHIFLISPDVIFSKGGHGALPATIAGFLLGTPIFLHESDAAPGATNRFLSKFAIEIFTAFPSEKTEFFPADKMISIGNPLRSEILNGSESQAKEMFHLTGEKSVILILGGSQGSQRINDIVLQALSDILKNFELIHQVGINNFKEVESESKIVIDKNLIKYYHILPFLNQEELANALRIADLVISRAGSGSIFEIAALAKPSILIPLPESAQNHQVKNAYIYAENGACKVLEESNLAPHFFLDRIEYLFSHTDNLEAMKYKAKDFSKPYAAKIIASYLLEYLRQ